MIDDGIDGSVTIGAGFAGEDSIRPSINFEDLEIIRQERKDIVYGYIRNDKILSQIQIPNGIILICILFYGNVKTVWTAKQCADWLGDLGPVYKQYRQAFVDNGIDGEFMGELDDELLSEIVPWYPHRTEILSAWNKLYD